MHSFARRLFKNIINKFGIVVISSCLLAQIVMSCDQNIPNVTHLFIQWKLLANCIAKTTYDSNVNELGILHSVFANKDATFA
jgi:hypothetical protein